MANSGVKVTISAVDRASMTLEKLNARIAAIQAPTRRLQAAFSRFGNVTGLRYLRTGMDSVGRAALGTFRTMGQIVPVLGVITSATSVAGVYRLASAWAQMGTNLRTSAAAMGMAPRRLMTMQNASRLAGGSADAMSGALQGLAQTRWEATHGFAPEAVVQFKALGISLEELKRLSPDQMFDRIAKKLRSIRDPAARTIAATKIFGGAAQGLLPIFQQTEAAYEANIRQAERLGLMNDKGVAAAARLQQAQIGLQESVEGLGYSIAESLEPVITPVVAQMRDWIAANREWIAQDIGRYVGQFITWLRTGGWDQIKSGIRGVYDEILSIVNGLGGWKSAGRDALIALGAIYAAPVITGFASLAGGVLSVAAAFVRMTSEARTAEAASIAASRAGFLSSGTGLLGRGGLALTAGYAAHEALTAGDPNDRLGSWIDRTNAGSYVDNLMSYLGLGRSYSEQARVQSGVPYTAGMLLSHTGASQSQYDIFSRAIAGKENARYDQMGGYHNAYAGRYQMSRDAISEAARYLGASTPSRDQFLHDPGMQERFFEAYSDLSDRYLSLHTARYRNATPQQKLAMLGYAHNEGMGAALSWIDHGQVRRDGFGTPGTAFSDAVTDGLAGPALNVPSPTSSTDDRIDALGATISKLRLQIEIDHKNAPAGSRVKVRSASPQLAIHTTQQARAMDPEASAGGY